MYPVGQIQQTKVFLICASTKLNNTDNSKPAESIEDTLNKLTAEIEGASLTIKEAKKKIEDTRTKEKPNNDFIVSETLS